MHRIASLTTVGLLACSAFARPGDDPILDKFAGHATIVQGFECEIVVTQNGSVYAVENLGPYGVGDCVYLEGVVGPCDETCLWHDTCILDNTVEPCCPGDATGDFRVDVDDLIAVVVDWGCAADEVAGCTADLNADQHVDVEDLIGVLAHWGGCPVP